MKHTLGHGSPECPGSGAPPRGGSAQPSSNEEKLRELAAEFEAGGDAERDADEPGVPSSVYYDCAAKVLAALKEATT